MEVYKPKETYHFTWSQLLVDQIGVIIISVLAFILAPIMLPALSNRRHRSGDASWIANLYSHPKVFILVIAIGTLVVIAVSTAIRLRRKYVMAFLIDDADKVLVIQWQRYFDKKISVSRIPFEKLGFKHAVGESLSFIQESNFYEFKDGHTSVFRFNLHDARWQTRYDKHNLALLKESIEHRADKLYR